MVTQNTQTPRSSFLPFPELVEPGPHDGPWTVADSNDQHWLPTNGATDKLGKKIYVPLEAGGEGVSLHELAHVRWSPDRFPRVRFPLICLQAVEDARINLGLRETGLPFVLDREQLAHVAHLAAQDAKAGHVSTTIVRAIASLGTEAAAVLQAEIEALPPRAAEVAAHWVMRTEERLLAARKRVGGPVAPFRVAHQIAKDLAKDLERRGMLPKDFEVRGLGCCQVMTSGEDGDSFEGRARGLSAYERILKRRRRGSEVVAVGHMRIARPPLTQRQTSVLRAGVSRARCRTEGTSITRPDRLALDRAIFGRTGRGGGGTVLVDTSGSMSISAEEVEKIVRAAGGAAVVAIYSGSGDAGELRIVARGDRRVASDQFKSFGGGNVVDLPALEWLAKQPTPRLWLSDGCVTGVGDQGCEKLLERCKAVVERGRIQRVEDAAGALVALR
jgi:hypothetical protein